jgi:hypothetical protein
MWKKSPVDASFCSSCGASFKIEHAEVIVVTTPTEPGYEIVKVLGAVHGLTVRTRGVGGKIVAGFKECSEGKLHLTVQKPRRRGEIP